MAGTHPPSLPLFQPFLRFYIGDGITATYTEPWMFQPFLRFYLGLWGVLGNRNPLFAVA